MKNEDRLSIQTELHVVGEGVVSARRTKPRSDVIELSVPVIKRRRDGEAIALLWKYHITPSELAALKAKYPTKFKET